MPPLRITGPRIALRPYVPQDLQAVLRYAADPDVVRFLPWGPEGPEEVQAFIARTMQNARRRPRREYELAAVLRETGELVGAGRIGILSLEHRCGDIGYVLRRDAWGRGLGGEIAQALLAFGFGQLGLHRIEATCDPGNAASRRVLERAGMRLEGLRREDIWVRGAYRDSLSFAVLAPEWSAGGG